MKRFASVTFDGVLAASARGAVVRSLGSAGVLATSWGEAGDRTYAFVELPRECAAPLAIPGARIDEPPLAVLRITPRDGARVAELHDVLGGPGRPLGVVDARREPGASVVTFAPRVTPLGVLLALVDATLEHAPGRTIEPILPLDDATLAAFARDLLGEPQLDVSRLIETHLAPLLAGDSP